MSDTMRICNTELLMHSMQEMYEQPRQRENGIMMVALDSLKRVFAPQSGVLASFRGLGLDIINSTPALKSSIMKYAMG